MRSDRTRKSASDENRSCCSASGRGAAVGVAVAVAVTVAVAVAVTEADIDDGKGVVSAAATVPSTYASSTIALTSILTDILCRRYQQPVLACPSMPLKGF